MRIRTTVRKHSALSLPNCIGVCVRVQTDFERVERGPRDAVKPFNMHAACTNKPLWGRSHIVTASTKRSTARKGWPPPMWSVAGSLQAGQRRCDGVERQWSQFKSSNPGSVPPPARGWRQSSSLPLWEWGFTSKTGSRPPPCRVLERVKYNNTGLACSGTN